MILESLFIWYQLIIRLLLVKDLYFAFFFEPDSPLLEAVFISLPTAFLVFLQAAPLLEVIPLTVPNELIRSFQRHRTHLVQVLIV